MSYQYLCLPHTVVSLVVCCKDMTCALLSFLANPCSMNVCLPVKYNYFLLQLPLALIYHCWTVGGRWSTHREPTQTRREYANHTEDPGLDLYLGPSNCEAKHARPCKVMHVKNHSKLQYFRFAYLLR